MNHGQYELAPDLWLDARRAAWLPGHGALVVSDLHLGYAWAHRRAGQMLPLTARENVGERLVELCDFYRAQTIHLLGDIVHEAIFIDAMKRELCDFFSVLRERAEVKLIAGNHDRKLRELLDVCGIDLEIATELRLGRFALSHGDNAGNVPRDAWLLMGHEHPAISISDRVASSAKCPCFLIGDNEVVLPAFSRWAAGANINSGGFLSTRATNAHFAQAMAIVGDRLLPIPL
ncbi:MAG: hypothetical protein M3O82_06760 [Verrucomicrobiota bacterium]|nr:hypothetical protein [Verrucomicrobiota bacterium]